jgi:hypothetical protein
MQKSKTGRKLDRVVSETSKSFGPVSYNFLHAEAIRLEDMQHFWHIRCFKKWRNSYTDDLCPFDDRL